MVSEAASAQGANVVMLVHNSMVSDARVTREASALANVGHKVTVLALKDDGLPEQEARYGFEIRRVAEATRSSWQSPLRKRSESRVREQAMADAAVTLDPDVVHCHDTDTLPAGQRIVEATGASWVFDAHELFPDMVAGHGRGGLVASHWRRVEKHLVPLADAVITVNEARAGVLEERYGVASTILRSVPELEPLKRTDRLRQELGIAANVRVVLYQGGLGRGRSLDRLVRAMERIDDAVLVLQGAGKLEGELREIAAARGLTDRVLFSGLVGPETLHEYACGADVGVVIYEPTSLNNIYAAPNKLYTYMMAGLPMVASDLPGLREVVADEGIGVMFNPVSDTAIAAAIGELLADGRRHAELSTRARKLAETRYNWERESKLLLALYDDLARRREAVV